MKRKAQSIAIVVAKFALPAAIIGYLMIWYIQPEQWLELRTQPKNYGLLAAALAVSLLAMSLSFARWCLLVRCQGIALSMMEAFRLGAICFLLSFVSVGSVGGDVFKAIFLAKRRPGKRVAAIASVVVDRGAGLYGLLMLVAAGLWVSSPPAESDSVIRVDQIKTVVAVLFAVGTAVLAVLVLGGRGVDRMITWGSGLPVVGKIVSTVGPPLRMFHSHPIAFAVSILMSLGVQSLLVISMFLVARGLYAAPPTLAEHFIIVPIGMLASALPITPGGVGVLELVIEGLYRSVPAVTTAASGTLVALVFEVVKIVMAIIGTVFYWTAGEEVRDSLEAAEEEGDALGGADSPSDSPSESPSDSQSESPSEAAV